MGETLAGVAWAVLSACASSTSHPGDGSGGSGSGSEADFGDPNAPGQDCPEAFDPDAVYLMFTRPQTDRNIYFFADVQDPSQECAFSFSRDGSDETEWTLGVRPDDGQMLLVKPTGVIAENQTLKAVHPDALERVDIGDDAGLWAVQTENGGNDETLVEEFAESNCTLPVPLMTYGPTGELGYQCWTSTGESALRRFTGEVIAELPRDVMLFLPDGRLLWNDGSSPGARLFVEVANTDDPQTTEISLPSGVEIVRYYRAQYVNDGVVVAALVLGAGPARFRLEGESLVLDEQYPLLDADIGVGIDQVEIDREGRVILRGTRETDDPELGANRVVLRLATGGNEVVYDFPNRTPDEVRELDESSGQLQVGRLIGPL